jgi:hypothetical protein
MGIVLDGGALRLEMKRRGWASIDLARESCLSYRTVLAAMEGRSVRGATGLAIKDAFDRCPPTLDGLLEAG